LGASFAAGGVCAVLSSRILVGVMLLEGANKFKVCAGRCPAAEAKAREDNEMRKGSKQAK
jgi:hypothetical protein